MAQKKEVNHGCLHTPCAICPTFPNNRNLIYTENNLKKKKFQTSQFQEKGTSTYWALPSTHFFYKLRLSSIEPKGNLTVYEICQKGICSYPTNITREPHR